MKLLRFNYLLVLLLLTNVLFINAKDKDTVFYNYKYLYIFNDFILNDSVWSEKIKTPDLFLNRINSFGLMYLPKNKKLFFCEWNDSLTNYSLKSINQDFSLNNYGTKYGKYFNISGNHIFFGCKLNTKDTIYLCVENLKTNNVKKIKINIMQKII